MEWRIKIHRKFIDREWYDDINTKVFFLHLLLIVNHKETKWRWITIPRWWTTRTLETLSNEIWLSKQNIRTVIKKLKSTQELTQEKIEKHWVITINNYDKYQSSTQELTPSQHGTNTGSTLNKNDNNEENEKKTINVYKPKNNIDYNFVEEFIDKENPSIKYQITKNWLDVYLWKQYEIIDKLINDWFTLEQIQLACLFVKQDDFRKNQILSIKKFRDKNRDKVPYIVVMLEKAKSFIEDQQDKTYTKTFL